MDKNDALLTEKLYCGYLSYITIKAESNLYDKQMSDDVLQDCAASIAENITILKARNEKEIKAFPASSVKSFTAKYNRDFCRIADGMLSEDAYCCFEDDEERIIRFDNIISMLKELSERDRKIIIMKYKYLMSDDEIAEILDIKKDSVRMTVRRSVFRLKKKLGVVKNYEAI